MKKRKMVLVLLFLIIMLPVHVASDTARVEPRKLIVFYSLGGNTRYVANHIQSLTGASIVELLLVNPYSPDFHPTLDRVRREQAAAYLPALRNRIDNLADYDIIFIGSPNWIGTLSRPVLSFIDSHDLSDKIIIPFITHGTGGFQNTINHLRVLLPNNTIHEALGIFDRNITSSRPAILAWLQRTGMH